jgi:hypothetical protein
MTLEVKDGILKITPPGGTAALPKKIPLEKGTPTHGGGE